MQWAAVSTWVEEIRVPPHQGVRPFLLTSPTWRLCLQSVLVEDIFKTDLPWVLVLLSLLTTNNTAVGSATLHSALERQASVKMFKMLRPGRFPEQQSRLVLEQLW